MARPRRRGFFGRVMDRIQFALDYPKRAAVRRRRRAELNRQIFGPPRKSGFLNWLFAPVGYFFGYPRRLLNQMYEERRARRLTESFKIGPKPLPRSKWVFIGAIPAVTVGVALSIYMFSIVPSSRGNMQGRYERWANEAADSNEKRAKICLQRLAREFSTESSRFRLVKLNLKSPQTHERGLEMLAQMAPLEGHGYLPAHREMADHLLRTARSPADIAEAEKHLIKLLDDSDLRYQATHQLGRIYISRGEWAKAEQHLTVALVQNSNALLDLATVYSGQQKPERAEQALKNFVEQARLRLRQNPDYDGLRWDTVKALASLGEFNEAITLIRDRPGLLENNTVRTGFNQLIAGWAISETEKNPTKALQLVQEGLAFDPTNGPLYSVLVAVAEGKNPGSTEAAKQLEKYLSQGGPLSDQLHFLVASYATIDKNYEKAQRHYEIVFSRNPNGPVLANNLAYVLSHLEKPQLDRALDLVNKALDAWPKNPEAAKPFNIRETRGQIYLKKKMWKEAVVDLEFALQYMPQHEKIHLGLAEAYDGLGDKGLAERHRELAKQSNSKQAPKGKK